MAIRNKLVYICSPLAGDMESNIKKAIHYCREAVKSDPNVVPIAPHIYCTRFLDDNVPAERAAGLDMGLALLAVCSEIWVYGIDKPSEGMKAEIQYAKTHGIRIIAKPRLINLPSQNRAKPVIDPDRVQFWKETYLELNKTCPGQYGDAHLRRKLTNLRNQESDYDDRSLEDRSEYYACLRALEIIMQEKSLTTA